MYIAARARRSAARVTHAKYELKRRTLVRAIAWIPQKDWRLRLKAGLRDIDVVLCENPMQCREVVAAGGVELAVLAYVDGQKVAVLSLAQQLRQRQRFLYVALYVDMRSMSASDVLDVGRHRLNRIIVYGENDDLAGCMEMLHQLQDATLTSRVLHTLEGKVPNAIAAVVRQCLLSECRRLAVDDVAARLRVSRRTLVRRCQAAHCPAPAALISWCRLLYAAYLLDDWRRPIDHVADLAGFSSGVAFRNMLRRYTGLRPGELREHGGSEWLVECFAKQMKSPQLAEYA
jgi:AraC-like DNA-binding protein